MKNFIITSLAYFQRTHNINTLFQKQIHVTKQASNPNMSSYKISIQKHTISQKNYQTKCPLSLYVIPLISSYTNLKLKKEFCT